jgi:4-hydroxy-tetrahydrodipicolinate synthase
MLAIQPLLFGKNNPRRVIKLRGFAHAMELFKIQSDAEYIKCDAEMIARRVELLRGSNFKLLNANCQTFLRTMRDGADGYCGIMCNFHPKLYAWLGENYARPEADSVQAITGIFGFTEVGLPYPLTAKYHMNLVDVPMTLNSRSADKANFGKLNRIQIDDLVKIENGIREWLGN